MMCVRILYVFIPPCFSKLFQFQAVVGDISDDFLNVNDTCQSPAVMTDDPDSQNPPAPTDETQRQIQNDEAAARALAASDIPIGYAPGVILGRLSVTVAQVGHLF